MSSKTLFVVGAGPGIASGVVKKLISEGYTSIGLISRSQSTLDQVKTSLPGHVRIVTVTGDAAEPSTIIKALDSLKSKLGSPNTVLYNSGSYGLGETPIGTLTVEALNQHFNINTASALATSHWSFQNLDKTSKGTVLITGGHPPDNYAGLLIGKVGLRQLARLLHNEGRPLGVHVAYILVGGVVNENDPKWSPKLIAEQYSQILAQVDQDRWTGELVY